MFLISVQHGGLGDVDGVILGLESETGRGLLEIGVGLPLLFCSRLVCPCSWCSRICCSACRYIPQGDTGCIMLWSSFETRENATRKKGGVRERNKKL